MKAHVGRLIRRLTIQTNRTNPNYFIMKKIERKELKSIIGGDQLPDGWGICIVKGEHIPTPCNEYCPDKIKSQPYCTAPIPGQMS